MNDGLGDRRIDVLHDFPVEILDIKPTLCTDPAFEAAIRGRAARMNDARVETLARVHRIDRDGRTLRVITDCIEGIRLTDLLSACAGSLPCLSCGRLELASRVIRPVALLHQKPGLYHGAITPDHIVIGSNGQATLTDCPFATALEGLQLSRAELWRQFGLAMPASAGLPRFDARSDVTQLGAAVLMIALGRPLAGEEYPRSTADLIDRAAPMNRGELDTPGQRLRVWLHHALQLHPRENYASAIQAERAFTTILGPPASRRAGALELDRLLQQFSAAGIAGPAKSAPTMSLSA